MVKEITTDLLVLQNADHFATALRTSHHSMCRHGRQVARSKFSDRNWTLVWTDQLIFSGIHFASPAWTTAFNKIISIRIGPFGN